MDKKGTLEDRTWNRKMQTIWLASCILIYGSIGAIIYFIFFK